MSETSVAKPISAATAGVRGRPLFRAVAGIPNRDGSGFAKSASVDPL